MSSDNAEGPVYSAIYSSPTHSRTIPIAVVGLGIALLALTAARSRARGRTLASLSWPLVESSSSLVDSAARVLRQRAEATRERALAGLSSPIAESSSSLVDSATNVFRQRADAKTQEFIGATQAQVASGAEKLSDQIERWLANITDGMPGGTQARPLIASAIQVALAAALQNLLHNRAR